MSWADFFTDPLEKDKFFDILKYGLKQISRGRYYV